MCPCLRYTLPVPASEPPLQDDALVLIIHDHLASQAEHTFIGIDAAQRVDSADGALGLAEAALAAALWTAMQPVEQFDFRRYGQRRTEWTQVAAIKALDEEAGREE